MLIVKEAQRCYRCDEDKPLSEFGRDSRTATGYRTWCKLCVRKYAKERRSEYTKEATLDRALAILYPLGYEIDTVDYSKLCAYTGIAIHRLRTMLMDKVLEKMREGNK